MTFAVPKQMTLWQGFESGSRRKLRGVTRHLSGRSELPVHWFAVVRDLKYAGLSMRNIAKQIDLSRSQVARMYNENAEPKFAAGERLLRLWMLQTGKSEEQIPRISKYDWRA